MMRSEMAVVREPCQSGLGASSIIPQKRNPIACPVLIATATGLRGALPSQATAMIQEHERSVAGQTTEWLVISEAFVLASSALRHALELLSGMEIDAVRMRANLELGNGLLIAESVMVRLEPKIGRVLVHSPVWRRPIGPSSRAPLFAISSSPMRK